MYLVQVLLPTFDNAGKRMPREHFDRVRTELTKRFGGVTAHVRSPAEGLWEDPQGIVRRDDIAIFEVMTDTLDRGWWASYRLELEQRFAQQEIVVRATEFERL